MRTANKDVKRWIEPAVCIGYRRYTDGSVDAVFEGVALFTDGTISKAWKIEQPPGVDGLYHMSLDIYLDCPQVDIWNTPKSC